jgi:hypothetical protein
MRSYCRVLETRVPIPHLAFPCFTHIQHGPVRLRCCCQQAFVCGQSGRTYGHKPLAVGWIADVTALASGMLMVASGSAIGTAVVAVGSSTAIAALSAWLFPAAVAVYQRMFRLPVAERLALPSPQVPPPAKVPRPPPAPTTVPPTTLPAVYTAIQVSTAGRPDDLLGYYHTLGISPSATSQQVRLAMRCILQREATDTGKQAQERFNAVMQAYRVLSDPGTRAVYDRRGTSGANRQLRNLL